MIKAFIFDVDGVIFDTERNRFRDIRRILRKHGMALAETDFKDMLGKKTEVFVKEKFPHLTTSVCKEIAQERRELQYHELKQGRLIKGIPELLRFLKIRGYKLAVTTGSRKFIIEKLLDMYLLKRYFDVIVTGEDYKASKPNPACYRVTLSKLRIKTPEAVIIEDAMYGVMAAKKLGCTVFGMETYLGGKSLGPADKTFKRPLDIMTYLKTKSI